MPEARALKATLEGLGFQATLVTDASREEMVDALADFEAALRSRGGIAFFHYGGHGVQVAGKNYLLPANADIPDEKRVSSRSVDLDEVMAALDTGGSETNIVVLDACRNNPLPAQAGRSATRGLAVVGTKPRNSIIIYSAESGNVAQDGLFTPALTRALATPGADLSQVAMQVRREVYDRSKGGQTTGEYNQLFTPVYLAGGAPGSAQAKAGVPSSANALPSAVAPAAPTMTIGRAYGSLKVTAATAGALYLDGTKLGDLPAGASADLGNIEAGERRLELRYAEGAPETRIVSVAEGRATSVSFSWIKPASPLAATPSAPQNAIGDLVFVKGGSFMMGAGEGGETPHEVSLSSFYIGKYEVTQGLYQGLIGKNPSKFTGDSNRPVEQVSWNDAVEFCNRLSEKEGYDKVYSSLAGTFLADFSANGYRLPTEAEWEYAAKGGGLGIVQAQPYAGSADPNQVAWHKENSGKTTHPVGQKTPNALGLFDMSGNVFEWCWDMKGKYSSKIQVDPIGAIIGIRVLRGGDYSEDQSFSRVASRYSALPLFKHSSLGFRLVRRP